MKVACLGDSLLTYWTFFSSRRRHTTCSRDWSSDVCSSDIELRFRLDEIHLGQTEPGEVVAVVLLHVLRVGGPLVDARALAFARGRHVSDAHREAQRGAPPGRRGLVVLDVPLRPHEEHHSAL